MDVLRIGDAEAYAPPKHFDMRSLRLGGSASGGPKAFFIGLSHFLPGGGAESDSSPTEKVYVVVSGEMTVVLESGAVTLGPLDSCTLAPNERRSIENRTNLPASMLVVIGTPPA